MRAKKNSVFRALRGGCYGDGGTWYQRVTFRDRDWPVSRSRRGGFRFVIRIHRS